MLNKIFGETNQVGCFSSVSDLFRTRRVAGAEKRISQSDSAGKKI